MNPPILLDPAFRSISIIFTPEDLDRLRAAGEVVWGKDEPAPAEEIDAVREEITAIICGGWRHGGVERFPNLRAILEVSGSRICS